jgi:acyl dehydratase
VYAEATDFGGRVAHGNLTAVQGLGMQVYTQVFHHAMALLEETHKYTAGVRVGDTIYSSMEVVDMRETKKADRGIVFFRNTLVNQRDEVVCISSYSMMMRRRASG